MSEKQVLSPRQGPARQLAGLDLLRGAAAILVLTFHLGFFTWLEPGLPRPPALARLPLTPLFSAGWVGVEIFFLLSGFVIAYSTVRATPLRFVQHRAQRLIPAALICASVTALARLINHQPTLLVWRLWLKSVSFSPTGLWIDGSYWTLPVEISFYLLVLGVLFWQQGRYLVPFMAALGTVSTLCCLLLFTSPQWVAPHLLGWLGSCDFPPRACCLLVYGVLFALGVLLHSAWRHGLQRMHLVFLPICFVGVVAELGWRERVAAHFAHRTPNPAYPLALWFVSFLLLLFSVWGNAWISQILTTRGVVLSRSIGLTTYPLYLIHSEIGQWLIRGFNKRFGYAFALLITTTLLVTLAASIALQWEPRLRSVLFARSTPPRGLAPPPLAMQSPR